MLAMPGKQCVDRIDRQCIGPRSAEGAGRFGKLAADGSVLWHGFITDITERKLHQERTHRLAYYDPLTSLPNRRLLHEHWSSGALRSCNRAASFDLYEHLFVVLMPVLSKCEWFRQWVRGAWHYRRRLHQLPCARS